jgi:diguanylate cyclase
MEPVLDEGSRATIANRVPAPLTPARILMPPLPSDSEPPPDPPTGKDVSSLALASLRHYDLPITPHTFAVWYEYHRGGMPELNRVLNIMISNKVGMNEERFSSLHAKYLGGPEAFIALRGTSERMQQTIGNVLSLMHTAGQDANRFGAAVKQVNGQFAKQEISIEGLVRGLLTEAQEVVNRTRQMEAELARNAELMKSLQRTLDDARRDALTDGLTSLANRRHFDETMQTLAGKAMNDDIDLSLILLDIDHFKRINDTFGHPVGDQVLQLVAATVRNNLRPTDFAARYGGEEFAVLLPNTSSEGAVTFGNRLREAFSSHRIVVRETRQPIGIVTVSAGVAAYNPGESIAGWLKRADTALYAAKQGGRNRVVEAEAVPAA